MTVLMLALLSLVVVAALGWLREVLRARRKAALTAAVRGLQSDAPERIGISVLCSGITAAAQIENLLSVEYPRYEVIVVIDATRYPEPFSRLVSRYRMIRVEWHQTDELDDSSIRSLGRSRKRCYRRLVLVNRAGSDSRGDYKAAAAVAAYDYLLPLDARHRLLPDAIARLAVEIGACGEEPRNLRLRSGVGALLLLREEVVAEGGFSRRRWTARNVWQPFFEPTKTELSRSRIRPAVASLLFVTAAATAAVGWWPVTALLVTWLVVVLARTVVFV